MIAEILGWLPVRSLPRCMRVCKEWCSLIREKYFISVHMGRGAPLSPHDEDNPILDEDWHLIDSFSGLLLHQDLRTFDIHICNPVTRQLVVLPDPNPVMFKLLDQDNSTFYRYSALNLRTHECKLIFGCHTLNSKGVLKSASQVLSVGRDDHWRPLNLKALFTTKPPRIGKIVGRYFMRYEGDILSVKLVRNGRDWDMKVVSFNIWRESFRVYAFPRGTFSDLSQNTHVFLWDNKVAFSKIIDDALHVMVLERYYEAFRWSNSIRVVPLRFLIEETYTKEKLVPVRATSWDLWFNYFEENIEFVTKSKWRFSS
ncbi:F-box domain containing protein [Trema orientale]|uniref:F-box domain containing protein n=1 Tax=Trema orientale TaxID=63057 RepID=A0A2P5CUU1_TREOI|nr:F-box domain containing protein [Trema orientale]